MSEDSIPNGNIYFLTDDEREAVLWAICLGLAWDDGFPFPRDQNRELLRSARESIEGLSRRHKTCCRTHRGAS